MRPFYYIYIEDVILGVIAEKLLPKIETGEPEISLNSTGVHFNSFGVKLLGGGLDEAPFAYKDIQAVMQSQTSLVDVVGKFTPKIVKMCGAETNQWRKPKKGETAFVAGE